MFLLSAGFNLQQNYKQYEKAKIAYQGSLSLWQDIQRIENGMGIVRGLLGLAEIAANQGQGERSGWLFGAADQLTPSSGLHRDALKEKAARIREHLDAAATATFEAAWTQGQRATLEEAIQKAVQRTV